MVKLFKVSIVLVLLVGFAGPAYAENPDTKFYSNQTPYGNPASTEVKAPPAGYEMLFIETLSRHGSRSNTSDSAEKRALAVWNTAKKKGGLTTLGKSLSSDITWFQKAEKAIGYGNLSPVGKTELAGFGRRTAENYKPFLEQAKADGDAIQFQTSSVFRTLQSYTEMFKGLNAVVSGIPFSRTVQPFDISSGSTVSGRTLIGKVKASASVRTAAINVLRKIYTAKYVGTLSDPVAKAMDIYLLYCTAPMMKGMTAINFEKYVSLADAKQLGYMKDTENFYRFGPGVKYQDNSYIKSKFVLNDFFAKLDARIAGGKTAAVFRHGHGETTMPFAALIAARGSDVQVPAASFFTYTNPWRGYIAGRPAGNIEWVAYRNAANNVVVTMRYNEEPIQFRTQCAPTEPGGYFYTVATLKSCLPITNPHAAS